MILSKTVEENDYQLIDLEVKSLQAAHDILTNRGVKIELGHPHRFWEYGMAWLALDRLFHRYDQPSIVDVGAGDGLLLPTLALNDYKDLTEVEPNMSCSTHREVCNTFLEKENKTKINWQSKFQDEKQYDIVFCISVIEHIAADHDFLRILSERVAKNGLLFMTTDVMPVMPGKYHFDNLREHNYTMFDICKKIEYLHSIGFSSLGDVDLEYKGDKVFNYSFCSLAMVKTS